MKRTAIREGSNPIPIADTGLSPIELIKRLVFPGLGTVTPVLPVPRTTGGIPRTDSPNRKDTMSRSTDTSPNAYPPADNPAFDRLLLAVVEATEDHEPAALGDGFACRFPSCGGPVFPTLEAAATHQTDQVLKAIRGTADVTAQGENPGDLAAAADALLEHLQLRHDEN